MYCVQQVKNVDMKYPTQGQADKKWSTLRFPNDQPPCKDFKLWKEAIMQVSPCGGLGNWPGRFVTNGHMGVEMWGGEWVYLPSEGDTIIDIYTPLLVPWYSRTPNQYTCSRIYQPSEPMISYCTIREVVLTVIMVSSYTPTMPLARPPECFSGVLRDWGCTWMWDSMKLVGDEQLLDEAVEDNSVVAVTDGSFIWEMYLNLYSAAFIFECSNGRCKLGGSFLEQTMWANA